MPAGRSGPEGEGISEEAFLLEDLAYVVTQVGFQLEHLAEGRAATVESTEQSTDNVLEEMIEAERRFRRTYAEILRVEEPASGERVPGNLQELERQRAVTTALLEQAGKSWPRALQEAVCQHIAEDRRLVTALALLRPEPPGQFS